MKEVNEYKGMCLLRKPAFFMAGFAILLTLRIGLNAAPFCLVRFKLEEEMFGLYVSRIHNSMELSCFLAVVLGNVYVFTYNGHMKYISIAISWLHFVVTFILLGAFVTGGINGNITFFYWTLTCSAFVYGLYQVCIFMIGGKDIVFYLAAVPLSGIFSSLYQMIYLNWNGHRSDYDTYFILVTFQIVLCIMITLFTAALWTLVILEPDVKGKNPDTIDEVEDGLELDKLENGEYEGRNGQVSKVIKEKNVSFWVISPIFMCVFGLGLVYAYYPGIAPGLMVEFKYVHKIDMAIMIAASIPSVVIALISEFTIYGPNKKWEGHNIFWHGFLIFTIFEIVIGILFFRILHYKKTFLSKIVLNRPIMVGILTVAFYLCHNISIGVGFAGVEPNSNSSIGTFNLFLALGTMNMLEFMAEGYLMEVKKYTAFNWPTASMGGFAALIFWVKNSASNALICLRSILTTDLRSDLLSSIAEPLN